jgi:peptidoglycan/xylan/chitin deacetylase (PgdA/CDA1 family)
MFLHADIKGSDLPAKTLCLTYDDGPGESNGDRAGPKTEALGSYLCDEGISATFFVIGAHAEKYPHVLQSLVRQGHTIGNHTYSHPGLVALAEAGGDVVEELARTDAIIREFTGNRPLFFRAPYGNWRQVDPEAKADKAVSIVAEALNASGRFDDYIGPVNWDISAEDFAFWRRGDCAEKAAAAYLTLIEEIGRGIVLMHDSSTEEVMRWGNRTLELTTLLVTQLKRRGYRFVGIEELPQVETIRGSTQPGAMSSRCVIDATGICGRGQETGDRGQTAAGKTRAPLKLNRAAGQCVAIAGQGGGAHAQEVARTATGEVTRSGNGAPAWQVR